MARQFLTPVVLPADPTSGLQAATKQYVDTADAGKQAADTDLTALAGLDSATAGAVASDGSGWIKKTYAQFKTALGLVKADVGLGSVDNTSDAGKPVSTAQQTALDAKAVAARTLTAGTGLTGGGDLSADRTLTVAYGTSSTTAAAGNDSRITGAAPTASPTFTGTVTAARVVSTPVTVTYAATTTIDASLGNHFRITMTGALTLAIPTNPVDGQNIIIELIQDATGSRALTLTTTGTGCFNVTTAVTGAITLATTASTRSYIGATYRSSGTKWDILAFGTGIPA